MGVEAPESAKMVLLQEAKFKSYYNKLSYALEQYEEVVEKIMPITATLLKPHLADMERKVQPGMVRVAGSIGAGPSATPSAAAAAPDARPRWR